MANTLAHFLRLVALCSLVFTAVACTNTVYVRVPAVCAQDTECLAVDQSKVTAEAARARESAYVRRTVASTVTVRGMRYDSHVGKSISTGTGTIIGSKGYVITAYHVIQAAQVVTVALRVPTNDGNYTESREAMATPLASSVEADVTLLFLNDGRPETPSLTVRHDPIIVGDHVWYLGARGPLKTGDVVTIGIGADRSPQHFADVQIAAAPRDSGAAVLNVCGEIVGVSLGPYGANGRLRLLPIDDAMAALGITRADLR